MNIVFNYYFTILNALKLAFFVVLLGETAVDWQWVILDGPVDPLWIENLNSVLDDSKTLCLANSERIYLSPAFRVIFEVDSVSQANPATISRCAMVYVVGFVLKSNSILSYNILYFSFAIFSTIANKQNNYICKEMGGLIPS